MQAERLLTCFVVLFGLAAMLVACGGDNDDSSGDDDDDINGDDDNGDDDSGDDDIGDDDDDTGDDDTHEDTVGVVSGDVTFNGSTDVLSVFGLEEEKAHYSPYVLFVETTTEERSTAYVSYDVDPGEPHYCLTLEYGTYDVWLDVSGAANDPSRWVSISTLLEPDVEVTGDTDLDLDATILALTGTVTDAAVTPVVDALVEVERPDSMAAALSESARYSLRTGAAGDYAAYLPAGDYHLGVETTEFDMNQLSYTADVALTADTVHDVSMADPASANAVHWGVLANGESPFDVFDMFSARLRLNDAPYRVGYWAACVPGCDLRAPDGSYTPWLRLTGWGTSEPAYYVQGIFDYDDAAIVSGETTFPDVDAPFVLVSGTVLDYDQNPFAGVSVSGTGSGSIADGAGVSGYFLSTTDATGAYRALVPAGDYQVNFDPPDEAEFDVIEKLPSVIVSGATTADFAFPGDYVTVSGDFTINGDPLTDYYSAMFSDAGLTFADADGYPLHGMDGDPADSSYEGTIGTGTYWVDATYQGARLVDLDTVEFLAIVVIGYRENYAVTGNQTLNVDLTAHPVSGTITDHRGDPVPGARAFFDTAPDATGKDPFVFGFAEAVAGADGKWDTWLPPGEYEVSFAPPECYRLPTVAIDNVVVDGAEVIDFAFE